MPTALPTDINIRRYYTESFNKITSHAIITDGFSVGNYPWNYRRIYSVSNVPAGNFFFGARVSVNITVDVFVGGWFFLFATELATKMEFTDDCYIDGRVPSVSPSVWFSPTDFITVTDGMSPSVKLDNVVVFLIEGVTKKHTSASPCIKLVFREKIGGITQTTEYSQSRVIRRSVM
jgi:hypothetical protein